MVAARDVAHRGADRTPSRLRGRNVIVKISNPLDPEHVVSTACPDKWTCAEWTYKTGCNNVAARLRWE